jgi:hypothetical protein
VRSKPIIFAQASISFDPASIIFAQAVMCFTSAAISIDVEAIPFVVVQFSFDARVQDIASEVIEEVDASKGENDAFISMCSAGIQEDAWVKDEPSRLAWKPAEVKGIERTTIGIEFAGKEIDAALPLMRYETKVIPSRAIDERSSSKGMRHERTDETVATFGFLSAPTCFTAKRRELGAGLDAFHADSIGMADEAKSFTTLLPRRETRCHEFFWATPGRRNLARARPVATVASPPTLCACVRRWRVSGGGSSRV